MANNRMILRHNPSGKLIVLAKRMGDTWYTQGSEFKQRLDNWLEDCWFDSPEEWNQDDYSLILEDTMSLIKYLPTGGKREK